MNKFWLNFVISQLFLVGIVLNVVTAIRGHDLSLSTVERILGGTLWYLGITVQLPVPVISGKILKAAPFCILIGIMLMFSSAINDMVGMSGVLASVVVSMLWFLAIPVFTALLVGGVFAIRHIWRRYLTFLN